MPKINIQRAIQMGYTEEEIKKFANSRGITLYSGAAGGGQAGGTGGSVGAQQAQPDERGNILTNALPLIGGVVGGIGGGILGAGAGGVGAIPGAIAGSAAGGALGKAGENFFEEGRINPEEVGKEAIYSGAFGALGGGLGRVFGGGAKIGLKALGSSGVRAGAAKGTKELTLREIGEVGETFGRSVKLNNGVVTKPLRGSMGAKAGILEEDVIPKIGEDLISTISKGTKLNKAAVRATLKKDMLASSNKPSGPGYAKEVDFVLKEFDSTVKTNADLVKFRNLKYAATQGGGAQPAARKVAVQEMYKGLNKAIKSVKGVEGVDSIVDLQPVLHSLDEVLLAQARQPVHIPFLGNSNLLRGPLSAVQDIGGRSIGRGAGAIANPLVNQPAGQAIGRTLTGGLREGGGQVPPQPQVPGQGLTGQFDTSNLPGQGQGQNTGATPGQPTLQEQQREYFNQMVVKDLAQTGGKNVSKIIAAAKFMLPEGEQGKLTEGQRNTVSNLSKTQDLILQVASELETLGLEEDPLQARIQGTSKSLLGRAGLGGRQGEKINSFRKVRKGLRVQIARGMGEVGNLSEPEQKAALDLLPDIGMSQLEVQENVRLIMQMLDSAKKRSLETPGGEYSSQVTGQESLSDEYLYQ